MCLHGTDAVPVHMKRVILLDTDIPVYQCASSSQEIVNFGGEDIVSADDFEVARKKLDESIEETMDELHGDRMICCLSEPDPLKNWRKGILPTYKENRKTRPSPVHRQALSDYVEKNFECFKRPTLEGDDVMGILATHPDIVKGEKIIVSIDKDMKTIPTRKYKDGFNTLYNPDKDQFGPHEVSLNEANWFWMMQTLMGDSTDGYKGCPRIGPKKARDILGEPEDGHLSVWWDLVCDTFDNARYKGENLGLGMEDALVQAQVARICRCNNYDFDTKEVLPWLPNS